MYRTETVTVRLDPKLRYLAELAALKQRRTLSSFIEWAIEGSLDRVTLREAEGLTVANDAENLWDVDESDRFAKLAFRFPDLLTHEEQVLWKLIRENGVVWRGQYNNQGEWEWKPVESALIYNRLREQWAKFRSVAAGEAEKSILPIVPKGRPAERPAPAKKADFDDDIPF